jgi:voltage-gated potassium channel
MKSNSTNNPGPFQIGVLILSVLVLAALAADTVCKLPPEVSKLIRLTDTSVCVVLLIDFTVRLVQAEDKRDFLKWGWIDLLASIPTVDSLRWGRLVRILRVIRLLRGIRVVHRVLGMVLKHKMRGGAVSLGITAFLLVAFYSI